MKQLSFGLVFCLAATIVVAQAPSDASTRIAGVDVHVQRAGELLQVSVVAPSTGWVAVGFDPSRGMAGANMIIGYVDGDTVMIRDDFGVSPFSHVADERRGGTSDITDVTGHEQNGRTTLTFSIPLDSGDALDKPLDPGQEYRILAAYGPDGADDFTTYHADRGTGRLQIPAD